MPSMEMVTLSLVIVWAVYLGDSLLLIDRDGFLLEGMLVGDSVEDGYQEVEAGVEHGVKFTEAFNDVL
jgi:hypothetical protein